MIALYEEAGRLDDRQKWPDSFEWMLSCAEKFRSVFAHRIKEVELPTPADGVGEQIASATDTTHVAPASDA